MTPASLPHDEPHRLAALRALEVLDSGREAEFDALVRVAAAVCETPIALISLVDADRQWFKANIGLPSVAETPRDVAFCAHAILGSALFEVPDATRDARFADNPLVVDDPHMRFYAGVPLQLGDGQRVGTLCVIDRVSRQLTDLQRQALTDLAGAAAQALEGRSAIRRLEGLSEELTEKHEQLRVTLHAIGDAIVTSDAAGQVSWLNPVAEALTGWTTVEARGRDLAEVIRLVVASTRTPIENPAALSELHHEGEGGPVPALLIGRHGSEIRIEASTSAIFSEEGVREGMVIVFRDLTERRRHSAEAAYRATHDPLTGLCNRSEFEKRLESLRQAATLVGQTSHALLYIDLDRFKLVNDACGHAAGDRLMQNVAAMLKDSVRSRDVVARMGGDDFAILLESCSVDAASRIAQSICDRMSAYRFVDGDRSLRMGTSIGLIAVDGHLDSAPQLLQSASAACDAAKDAGRNRVHVWSESEALTNRRTGDVQWASRIEEALDEDRFVLYAQRIDSLHAAGGLHAEVLLRMVERDGSLIQPAAFLPAVERLELAPLVDRWVLQHALDWMRSDAGHRPIERLSVNLSGQSVGDRDFCGWALDILSEAGPAICGRLCLEITETAAVTRMKEAAVFIGDVRRLGIRIALDDFGAGASSFGYLKTLAVDCIKIDGQFIRGLIDNPLDSAAVRCFVDVARVMGLETVAEFVDRPEILARVREMGVDFAQGYLLHRPAPIDELLAPCSGAIPITHAKPVHRSGGRLGVLADFDQIASQIGSNTW